MPLTTSSASNLIVPNVYVFVQQVLQAVNPYINTSSIGVVGCANWGDVNSPQLSSGPAQIFNNFGNDTIGYAPNGGGTGVTEYFSLVEEMLTALPEDGSCLGVRVTDGTDTAATITMLDTQGTPGNVLVLTANNTGSLPNGNSAIGVNPAQCRIDLVSSSTGVVTGNNPVFRITLFFPGQQPETFNNILGYTSVGNPYSSTAFVPNAIAAINGTAPGSRGSLRWVASAPGSQSNHTPALATLTNASGGTDGTTGCTFASLIGAQTAAPTGMYALTAGTGFFQLVLAGMNNLSYAPTISSWVTYCNAALGFATVPAGTSDTAAFASRLSNAAIDENMVLVKDYIQVYDTVQQTFRLVSPLGKAAGIIGMLPPFASPINEPWNSTGLSAGGVVATEQTLLGYPRSQDQLAALITNGFVSITNQMPINNGAFGFFDDVTSAGPTGVYIADQRMTTYLAQAFQQLGGQFVGQNQTTSANDPTRANIRATFNNFLAQLMPNGGVQWIQAGNAVCDLTNNTATTIDEGFCFVQVLVQYLGVIRILYVTLQGGTNVQVTTTPPAGYPA